MDSPRTESLDHAGPTIDALSQGMALTRLLDGQRAALDSIAPALAPMAQAAARMAETVRKGGRLVYAGAGSSGLMAMADALELHGTFGIPLAQVSICMAGGLPRDNRMPGDTEDETGEALQAGGALRSDDTAIVVTASGTTPFALAFAEAARGAGAHVIGLANNPGAPLFAFAHTQVCLATPPEVLAGSTRLGAGTAQKAALNLMSTLMGVELGHVHDGQMVNVRAENAKLRKRAASMVARIAGVSEADATTALDGAGGEVKLAVLLATGADGPDTAQAILDAANGRLGPALHR